MNEHDIKAARAALTVVRNALRPDCPAPHATCAVVDLLSSRDVLQDLGAVAVVLDEFGDTEARDCLNTIERYLMAIPENFPADPD